MHDQLQTSPSDGYMDYAESSDQIYSFEDLIKIKLGTYKETRPHPIVSLNMGSPPGGWGGWTHNGNCEGIGLPCYYRGAENPHKVLIWLHGMSQTGLLPASITDGLPSNVKVI